MGQTKGAYTAEFPVGTLVRVVSHAKLLEFKNTWRFHHPLTEEQLGYADAEGNVLDVGYYHGGDELYRIEGTPGLWHEACVHLAALEKQVEESHPQIEDSKDAANRRYADIEAARIVVGMNRLREQQNQENRHLAKIEATMAVAGLNRLREQKNTAKAAEQKTVS